MKFDNSDCPSTATLPGYIPNKLEIRENMFLIILPAAGATLAATAPVSPSGSAPQGEGRRRVPVRPGEDRSLSIGTHGHHFFCRGGEEFFSMCTWVKNGYKGGDVFGCHSLGEEGGKGGGKKNFNIKENNCLLLKKWGFFSHLLTVSTTQFDGKKRHAQ